MAAIGDQVLAGGLERAQQVEAGDAASGAVGRRRWIAGVEREHDRRAMVALDGLQATMPITPACQPRPRARRRLRSPISFAIASASQVICCSVARRSALTASSSRAIASARSESSVSSSSRPASARRRRPAALIRGAGAGWSRWHQDRSGRCATPASAPSALHVVPAVSRPARTSRRFSSRTSGIRSATVASRDKLKILGGRRSTERLGQFVSHRGPAQIGGRVAAERRMHDRAVGQFAVRARRGGR